MNKHTVFKFEYCFFACTVEFILSNGIISILSGELVFQLHRYNRNAINKQHNINAVFVIGRIVQLTGAVQHISRILLLCSLVDRGFGLPVNYTKSNPSVLKAVAKHGKQPERSNLLAKTLHKGFLTACPVYCFILFPRLRLSGFNKGYQRGTVQSGNTVKGFGVAFFVTAVCKQGVFYVIFKLFFG